MSGIARKVYDLIKPAVEQSGRLLWDVSFVKEGASHYLRVFIDAEAGVGIDDCSEVSHIIDPIIDEADPIEQSYYLEVCSPGLERELTQDWHFKMYLGSHIKLRLYRAHNGLKKTNGLLKAYDGGILLETENGEVYFEKKDYSSVRLDDNNF